MYDADIDENSADSDSSEEEISLKCIRLQLPEHIVAYLENKELSRDVSPLVGDSSLLENITTNYIIAKKIISNLTWQDKGLVKHVCSMWHSIVTTLQKEQLGPIDFSISLRINNIKNGIKYLKSSNFYTEPLAVIIFTNHSGFVSSGKCESFVPSPCKRACEKEHYLVDIIEREASAPKDCMMSIKACFLSYMPLPQTITYENAIRHKMFQEADAFVGGLYIPAVPNVKFTPICIKSVNLIRPCFYEVVEKLTRTRWIKGAIVFANDSYLLHSVEDIIFLNYFNKVQKNVPYALGGCIVEDSITEASDNKHIVKGINDNRDFISENLITLGLFTVPKDIEQDSANFDMFSLILESSDWAKAKIQSSINEFSRRVPHFEHSVAIKLSCVGRDQKHELEQQYFRLAFPNTRLVGCYGNGELGVNHPPRSEPEESPKTVKRHRQDPGPQYGVMYSYSTVFVYIGWGKILSQPEST